MHCLPILLNQLSELPLTYLHQVNQSPKTLLVLFQSAHFYCSEWKVESAYRLEKFLWIRHLSEVSKHLVKNGAKKLPFSFCDCSLFVSRGHSYVAFCFSYYRWEKKNAFKTNRVGTRQYGLHCKKILYVIEELCRELEFL